MGNAHTRDRLTELLVGPISDLGLDLEAVQLSQAGKRRVLRIAVDVDGGVSMDHIAAATRAVSEVLDETDVMGAAPYTLEVSSPGVDRPLTAPRHWRRNLGRLVKVAFEDAEPLTGRIIDSDEHGATIDVEGRPRQVPYESMRSARVQVEFTRPQPDDQSADEESS